MPTKKLKLFLLCSGLGRIHRGFESYIMSLASHLSSELHQTEIHLLGSGKFNVAGCNCISVPCLSRSNVLLNKVFGQKISAELEQISFFISVLPVIFFKKPNALYLGEYKIYCYLYKIRKRFFSSFSLVLYTGGQVIPGLFDVKKDYVHHVTDVYVQELTKSGFPIERQFQIPHFFDSQNWTTPDFTIIRLQQPPHTVLSVGLIDNTIKQMGTLGNCLSKNTSIFFPILLGEMNAESASIQAQYETLFGAHNFIIDTVKREHLSEYYKRADVFILLSPRESFGMVFLEALWHGLPVISLDYPEARKVLGNHALFLKQSELNCLNEYILQLINENNAQKAQARHQYVVDTYGWPSLKSEYKKMFQIILN